MQFAGIENPFGAVAYAPAGIPNSSSTLYYKGMRLHRMPVRVPRAPRPLSETVRNFLLTYDK